MLMDKNKYITNKYVWVGDGCSGIECMQLYMCKSSWLNFYATCFKELFYKTA
jgi:hypothetical protein